MKPLSPRESARAFIFLARLNLLAKSCDPADVAERQQLRDRVVLMSHELSVSCTWEFLRSSDWPTNEFDDCLQVARIGLIKAVDGFDVERGTQFSTYAWHKMRSELKHYARDSRAPIREAGWYREQRIREGREAETCAIFAGLPSATRSLLDPARDEEPFVGQSDLGISVGAAMQRAYGATEADRAQWERERLALELYFWGDEAGNSGSYSLIARRLRIGDHSAKLLVKRGLDRLRPWLTR